MDYYFVLKYLITFANSWFPYYFIGNNLITLQTAGKRQANSTRFHDLL